MNKDFIFIQKLVSDILHDVDLINNQDESAESPEFEAGSVFAYYDVLQLIKEEYTSRSIDLAEIGLDIDLDERCLEGVSDKNIESLQDLEQVHFDYLESAYGVDKATLAAIVQTGSDRLDTLIDDLAMTETEGSLAQDILDAILSEIEE